MLASGIQVAKGFSQVGEIVVNRSEPIISIINMIVQNTIHLMQCPYFLAVGTLESVAGLFKKEPSSSAMSQKIRSALHNFYEWIKSLPRRICSYNVIHGGLMLGTGVCELLLGLQQFDWLSLGAATPFVAAMSNGCFVLGNIVMLIHNAKLFHQACQLREDASNEEKQNAKRVKMSAVFSMISAINYIVGITTMLFGGPVALIVMLVSLGLTFGGLKILYDWVYPYREELLNR
jgi:hypothetical protein